MGIRGVLIILGSVLAGAGVAAVLFWFVFGKQSELPVPLNHKAVDSALVNYNFKGVVTEVTPLEGGGALAKLDTADSEIPRFLVSNDTSFYRVESDGTQTITSVNEFKVGSSATLTVLYNLKDKTWKVMLVTFRSPTQ